MTVCPPETALRLLLHDLLPEPEAEALTQHVETCSVCTGRLDALTDPGAVVGSLPRVDGYQIEAELGRGGMGAVYRARPLTGGGPVALKMMARELQALPAERERFAREVAALARLEHPNIVRLLHYGEQDGCPYLVVELAEGETLARRCRGRPHPARWAAAVVERLARAVAYAHRQGVLHRDLKPANILLSVPSSEFQVPRDEGTAPAPLRTHNLELTTSLKITDFGTARLMERAERLTAPGALLGTPEYMAPEQLGAHPVGPAADVHALGAILYELLTGRPPFCGATLLDTLDQVRSHDPVAPHLLNASVPRDLETICLHCLRKGPAQRYPTAESLAEDLARFLRGERPVARPPNAWQRVGRWGRRHPARAALLTVGAAALLVIGGVLAAWGHDTDRRVKELHEANQRLRQERDRAEATLREAIQSGALALRDSASHPRLQAPENRPVRHHLQEKAAECLLRLSEANPDHPRLPAELFLQLFSTANAFDDPRTFPRGIEFLRRAAGLGERLPRGSLDEPIRRMLLAMLYNNLGNILRKVGQTEEARGAFARGIDHAHACKPTTDAGEQERQEALATLWQNRGQVLCDAGDFAAAAAAHEEAWRLRSALVAARPGRCDDQAKLAVTSHSLHLAYRNLGRPDQAREWGQAARRIQEELVGREPDNAGFRQELAVTLGSLGTLALERGDIEGGATLLEEARGHWVRVVEANPDDLGARDNLGITWQALAAVRRATGQLERALKAAQEAVRTHEQLVTLAPHVADWSAHRGVSYFSLAECHATAGTGADALRAYDQAIQALEAVLAQAPQHDEAKRFLAQARERRAAARLIP